jgi:hypothetical protein
MAVLSFPSQIVPPAQRYLTPATRPYSICRIQKTFGALPSFNLIAGGGGEKRPQTSSLPVTFQMFCQMFWIADDAS